jgi:membrane protease YdiL (CAAX protease family)
MNKSTIGMILFVVCFYGLLFFMGRREEARQAHAPEKTAHETVTRDTIREREALFKKNLEKHPVLLGALSLSFIAVFCVGVVLNLYFLGRRLRGIDFISRGIGQKDVSWGPREVLTLFVFLFFVEAVIILLELLTAGIFGWKDAPKDLVLMVNSLLRDIFVAWFVIALVTRRFKEPLSEIGLSAKHFLKNVWTGVVGYLAVIPLLLAVLFTLAAIAQAFSYEPPPQPVVQMYLKKSTEPYLVFFTLFVAGAGPVIEEIFFRGFTYKAFRAKMGVRWALVISALIFAALHMNLIAFIPIFILGIFLGYLYEKTGSLVPSMTVHMLHNLIMVGLTLGFKSLSG